MLLSLSNPSSSVILTRCFLDMTLMLRWIQYIHWNSLTSIITNSFSSSSIHCYIMLISLFQSLITNFINLIYSFMFIETGLYLIVFLYRVMLVMCWTCFNVQHFGHYYQFHFLSLYHLYRYHYYLSFIVFIVYFIIPCYRYYLYLLLLIPFICSFHFIIIVLIV